AKDMIRIRKEIYGDHPSIPLPPLLQVIPDRFYYRGQYSRLWCQECGCYIGNGKSVNHYYCELCADIVEKRNPIQKPNWKEENKREYRAEVLRGGNR
ncbi:MAG: hypothetical protein M0Q91_14745, partial [Methanoregula sp.]|nr:hypothetical protein [Methanoregula sp.]